MSASFSTATCTPSITNPIYPRPSLGPTCIQSRHVLNDNRLLIRGGSKPFEVGKSGSYSRRNLFWRQLFSSNVHDCVVALVTHGPWLHPGYCIYGFFFFFPSWPFDRESIPHPWGCRPHAFFLFFLMHRLRQLSIISCPRCLWLLGGDILDVTVSPSHYFHSPVRWWPLMPLMYDICGNHLTEWPSEESPRHASVVLLLYCNMDIFNIF